MEKVKKEEKIVKEEIKCHCTKTKMDYFIGQKKQ